MTRVAVVTTDPVVRDAASRAFDGAPVSWHVSLEESAPSDADVLVWGPERFPGTGLVFDPDDPESALRAVRDHIAPKRVIWVCSAGGGQGCTTVAAHLAAYAVRGASSVCLVDAQPGSTTRYRIGVPFDDTRTWADVNDELSLAAVPTPHGFRALLAPQTSDADASSLIARCGSTFDRVVVDAGVSTTSPTDALRVLVMSPTIPAAHRALRALWADEGSWIVVTNRLGRGGETTRSQLERIVEHPIAVELPHCPALRDAEDDGRLVTAAWTRWSLAFARLRKEVAQ